MFIILVQKWLFPPYVKTPNSPKLNQVVALFNFEEYYRKA